MQLQVLPTVFSQTNSLQLTLPFSVRQRIYLHYRCQRGVLQQLMLIVVSVLVPRRRKWRQAMRKTRLATRNDDSAASGTIIANFESRVSAAHSAKQNKRRVRTWRGQEMPIFLLDGEPMGTAQSLGDDTHAVVRQPRWALLHRMKGSTDYALAWSPISVGCEPGRLGCVFSQPIRLVGAPVARG